MTKKEAVAAYRIIAKKLRKLHTETAPHISRSDNNKVFEMGWHFDAIADRIDAEYEEHCPGCENQKRDIP